MLSFEELQIDHSQVLGASRMGLNGSQGSNDGVAERLCVDFAVLDKNASIVRASGEQSELVRILGSSDGLVVDGESLEWLLRCIKVKPKSLFVVCRDQQMLS